MNDNNEDIDTINSTYHKRAELACFIEEYNPQYYDNPDNFKVLQSKLKAIQSMVSG